MKKRTLSTAAALLFMTVLSIPAFAEEYELANGSIEVTTDDEGNHYVSQPDNGISDEAQTTPTVITQTGTAATQNTITITAAENQTTEVTLKNVNIDVSGTGDASTSGSAAVFTSGKGNVVIELEKKNTVKSGYNRGGVEKNNDGHLTITAADNDGELTVEGGRFGAGIGGGDQSSGSNITITGGKVSATGGDNGAGIGGGYTGSGSNITITGGKVNAKGGYAGAGIGGGDKRGGSNITIIGATVKAEGGKYAAGIGGGAEGSGSDITIIGGKVNAKGGDTGAGIGGGYYNGRCSDIKVWGDVQLKTQGGSAYWDYGCGTGIGEGGRWSYTQVYAKDVAPNVTELTAKGKIEYYAPGADMETAEPTITRGTHVHEPEQDTIEILKQATCAKGLMTYICKAGNNFIVTEEIPPQHDYGTPEVWRYNEEEHYKECLRTSCSDIPGSIKERAAHTYESETSQVCTVCKYDRGHQHSLTLVSKKEASCTEAGHEAYYACSGCDSLFGNALGNVSVDRADLTIPATGHKYEGNTCTVCGYQKPSTTRSSGGSHHDSAEVTDNSQKGRWVQDEKGWYFRRNDGSYPKSGWSKLKWLGKEYWYYFDENGYMKLGWLDVNGSRYYMNPVIGTNSGRMLTGWQQIENQWYYFSTETGAKEGSLLRNTVTPDNYTVDENGIWQQ